MNRISEKTKQKRGYGTGNGVAYKPYIKGREFSSYGTVSIIPDYKTGRRVELLSRVEQHFWYLTRFDDNVTEIKEQFPLKLELTVQLAHSFGIKHPNNESTKMTTDFLVQYMDGHTEAFSIKANRQLSSRAKEKLFLEQKYWELQKIPYHLVFGCDMDVIKAENIRVCSYYYDEHTVTDKISCLKHMIITGKIKPDLSASALIPETMLNMYLQEVNEEWKKILH